MLAVMDSNANSHGGCAVAERPRLLTLGETVVLAGVSEKEKCIRNDIHRGVISSARVVRIDGAKLCFHWPYILTFAAVYGNDHFDSADLRKVALERVLLAATGANTFSGSCFTHSWADSFDSCEFSSAPVEIDKYAFISLRKVCESVRPRVYHYARGLNRIEENDSVLGGAAVFAGTRLSVYHVGKTADRGVPVEEIIEDYGLTGDDVEFAKLYYRARPPVGRPTTGKETDNDECVPR